MGEGMFQNPTDEDVQCLYSQKVQNLKGQSDHVIEGIMKKYRRGYSSIVDTILALQEI